MKYSDPKLLDHLASHYVLGTLSGGARRRFEKLINDRFDVRQIVNEWNEQLGKLSSSIPDAKPSDALWNLIKLRTQPQSELKKSKVNARGFLSRLIFVPAFSWIGGAAIGLSAAFAVLIFIPSLIITTDQLALRMGERLPQSYVGLLVDSNSDGKVLLSSLRFGKTAVIKTIGKIDPPKDAHLVLWALPPDLPPIRIGEVMVKGSAEYSMPDTSEKLFSKVTKLVVTLEQVADPKSIGTNVVFTGNCAKLW